MIVSWFLTAQLKVNFTKSIARIAKKHLLIGNPLSSSICVAPTVSTRLLTFIFLREANTRHPYKLIVPTKKKLLIYSPFDCWSFTLVPETMSTHSLHGCVLGPWWWELTWHFLLHSHWSSNCSSESHIEILILCSTLWSAAPLIKLSNFIHHTLNQSNEPCSLVTSSRHQLF